MCLCRVQTGIRWNVKSAMIYVFFNNRKDMMLRPNLNLPFLFKWPFVLSQNFPPKFKKRRHVGKLRWDLQLLVLISFVLMHQVAPVAVVTKQNKKSEGGMLGNAGVGCVVGHNLIFWKHLIFVLSEEWFLPSKLRLSIHTNWRPPSSLSGTLRHSLLGSCSFPSVRSSCRSNLTN